MQQGPDFAILSQEDFKLYLARPRKGDGEKEVSQKPGGSNRISIELAEFDSTVEKLKKAGCKFHDKLIEADWGKQAIIVDPSGNLIDLDYFKQWKPK